MKNSFVLYTDYRKHISLLNDTEKARLLDAIFAYADGEQVEVDGVVEMAFSFIRSQMDRDAAKWEEERQARSDAGKKGMANRWKNKKPITKDNTVITNDNKDNTVIAGHNKDNKEYQNITNITVTDNVTDTVTDNVTVNDIDKVNYQEIANLYNGICKSLPQVTRLSDKRKQVIKSRLKRYSIDDLKKAFQMAEDSDFLSGRSGKWTGANFDWLMNETNLVKVLEGNYRNNKTTKIDIDSNFRSFLESNEVVNWD